MLTFFTSCKNDFSAKHPSEVDLKNKTLVQLHFDENVYNCEVLFTADELIIEFSGNNSFPDGLIYNINSEYLTITYLDITKRFLIESLSEKSTLVIFYEFVKSFNGLIVTENYDSEKNCTFVDRDMGTISVRFEVFINKNKTAYSLYIK